MLTIDRDDQADHAHEQERAHAGKVALGRVAVEAEAGEGGRGREEGQRDRRVGVDEEDRRERQRPSPTAKAQKRICAVPVDSWLMPKLSTSTKASGASMITHFRMPGPNRICRRAVPLREQQGDDAGEQHARRHVIVDRQHVRTEGRRRERRDVAPCRVDRGRPRRRRTEPRIRPIGHFKISHPRQKLPCQRNIGGNRGPFQGKPAAARRAGRAVNDDFPPRPC